MTRAIVFGPVLGATLGLVVGVALVAAGHPTFDRGAAGLAFTLIVAAPLGACAVLARLALESPRLERTRLRQGAGIGAMAGAFGAFLVRHDATHWVGLGQIGAGAAPVGELALAVVPAAGALAGLVALGLVYHLRRARA